MSKPSEPLSPGKTWREMRRVETCPECGSDDIGQLNEGLPMATDEYEAAGGRYYCLRCGWAEQEYGGHVGLQSWCYGWPETTCAECGKEISVETSYFNWIDPENPERVLCGDCYQAEKEKKLKGPGWRGFLRRILG